MLAGIPSHLIKRMQSVMNSVLRNNHITPLFTQLHWLKVPERTEFKLAVLVYRCLHQTALPYSLRISTSRLLSRPVSVSTLHRHHCLLFDTPIFEPSSFSSNCFPAFPVAAAELWNTLSLNVSIVNICFLEMFEDSSLQSFLFLNNLQCLHSELVF